LELIEFIEFELGEIGIGIELELSEIN